MQNEKEILQKAKDKTLIAFACLYFFFFALIVIFLWMKNSEQSDGTPKQLRAVLNFNESFWGVFLSDNHLAPTFSKSDALKKPRVNGDYGMGDGFDASKWKLKIVRDNNDTLFISLDEIKALPKIDVIFNFKCIEGWSQITWWGGVRFSDFLKKFNLEKMSSLKYVGLETPDKNYYVGIDMKSMLHPQTILCYEMNGKPLPYEQGAPLRLIIPVKYGIKHLKRVGTMFFSDSRPRDYWFEQGYDYFAGL